jgi:hypothetical protein
MSQNLRKEMAEIVLSRPFNSVQPRLVRRLHNNAVVQLEWHTLLLKSFDGLEYFQTPVTEAL